MDVTNTSDMSALPSSGVRRKHAYVHDPGANATNATRADSQRPTCTMASPIARDLSMVGDGGMH
eukprot:161725-Amphidinium_carterae.1